MRYGFVIPRGDAPALVALAREAEAAGWDGVFVPDGGHGTAPRVSLGAKAISTRRVRLGPLLAPADIRAVGAFVEESRHGRFPFDIVLEGVTLVGDRERAASIVRPFEAAGAARWIESMRGAAVGPDAARPRIGQGPPAAGPANPSPPPAPAPGGRAP
jgi:hypothetical protein